MTLPNVRPILFADASLIAQAHLRGGVAWGDKYAVSAHVRKLVLWAIAWAEGAPIVYEELGAACCLSAICVKAAIYSLEKDGLVVVHAGRACRPSTYSINREALSKLVSPIRFGALPTHYPKTKEPA